MEPRLLGLLCTIEAGRRGVGKGDTRGLSMCSSTSWDIYRKVLFFFWRRYTGTLGLLAGIDYSRHMGAY